MLSPYMYAALAHERHQTFLAQAETDRRARQARLHRRQAAIPGARRSPRRRHPAWLQPGPSRLVGRWPRSTVTGRLVVLRDGSAVLIRQVQSADAPLLAGGFARDADDSQAAEIAVTIIDDWHGRGLGTELVAQLSERARSEGIRRFTALVAAGNPAMAGLLRKVRADFVRREPRALRYEIMLVPAEQYSPAGVFRSSDDPPSRLPDPATPGSAAVTIVTNTRETKARRGAGRVWFFDTNSGWAQRRARGGPGAEEVGQ